jgi:hypothetical protein
MLQNKNFAFFEIAGLFDLIITIFLKVFFKMYINNFFILKKLFLISTHQNNFKR